MSLRRRATSWILVLCLGGLTLSCGLTELLRRTPDPSATTATETPTITASSTAPAPSDTPSATPSETPSPDSPPTQTATPTLETSTDLAATDTPEPSPTGTPSPTPTETPPGLRIDSFEVELSDAGGGAKTIRCTWETSGAGSVRIVLGTRRRWFPIWQNSDPDGTLTFEATDTLYNNPDVTLTALGISGGEATESVTLDWPCPHAYFFAATVESPNACPVAEALAAQGAQQSFQGGAMMWIPGIEGSDWIYVLYNDGAWQSFEDTWHEGLPESDPSIIPPAGYEQPIRGFGKVWREHAEVQGKLNWATAGESAIVITYQRQVQESIGGVHFIQAAGAKLIRLDGIGGSGSTWISLP